jgi:signal transduction histidine kinase
VVRDHGIGIADDDLQRIFGRFERAVSKWHHGGLGLGLFVARQIVEAHSGTIKVETRRGKGSTFIVELPYEQPRDRPQPGVIFRTSKESKRTVP